MAIEHVPIAALPGMAERTVTISGLSKTYSVTGWRIGWAIAPAALIERHPQDARLPDGGGAGAAAGSRRDRARACPTRYYRDMSAEYQRLRDWLVADPRAQGIRLLSSRQARTT